MNAAEELKRNKLQREKPIAFDKMSHFQEKYERGESIAIVRIEYRYDCNFRCQHCCIDGLRSTPGRLLSPADVRFIADQAHDMGLARFVLTGGEPLVFKDLDAVVEAMTPERFYINLDTNGWLLDVKMARHLKSIGVDRVQLSIDSYYPRVHDEFRRKPGSWMRAIRASYSAEEAGLDLFIQTTVSKTRLYSDEFMSFVDYWNGRDIGVFVTFLKPVGAAAGSDDVCSREDFDYFEKLCVGKNLFWHLTPAYGRDMGCIGVKAMISVTPSGDVHPCPYWFRNLGNVLDEPLIAIVDRAMRQEPFCRRIGTCPVADSDWKESL